MDNKIDHQGGLPWRRLLASALLAIPLLLAGCVSSVKSQYNDVGKMVQERTGQQLAWDNWAATDGEIAQAIAPYLRAPLTPSTAARIALVNNRALQATLKEVDISRAALIQAMLPTNPDIFMRARWGTNTNDPLLDGTNAEFSFVEDVLQFITWLPRKRIAQRALEQVKSRVAGEAFSLVYQVQVACYTLQGRLQLLDEQRQRLAALQAGAESLRRQPAAGPAAEANLLGAEAALAQARNQVRDLERRARSDRETLNRLMGLSGAQAASWTIAPSLPPLPAGEPPLEQLESRALDHRLDLAVVRRSNEVLSSSLRLTRRTRFTPSLKAGVDYERALGGLKLAGPFLSFTLPIFDWGQAKVAAARANYEQGLQRQKALETDIRSGVREARENLLAARDGVAAYRDEILPRQQRRVELTRAAGAADLAAVEKDVATAQSEYTDALTTYWIARARLALAAGSGVPSGPAPPVLNP